MACWLAMARESTLRGSGRNASGPLVATWQMLEWMRDNGPADREAIKDACAGFVDPGYARRWYDQNSKKPAIAKRALTLEQKDRAQGLAHIPVDVAQRAKLGDLLSQCVVMGTLARDGDVFTFLRMPKRTPAGMSVEQVTSDPTIQRRHIYEAELVRQLRAAEDRGVFQPGVRTPRLLKKELAALFAWLGTYDHVEEVTVTGVQLDAIVALRGLRDRVTDHPNAKQTTAEKDALRALWLALDKYAPPIA